MRPLTVAPRNMAGGGSIRLTRTRNVRVIGSAWGSTCRTRPIAVTEGSSVRDTVILGSAGAERITWAGTSNTASRPSWRATWKTVWPGLHDLAGFGGSRRDRAGDTRPQRRVAHAVLGDVQLRLGVVDVGLRRAQRLLGLVEQDLRGEALRQEGLLAIEGIARLHELAFRGRERGLCRAQGVQLVLRIELRQHLIGLDASADIDHSFDDAAADAEGQRRLVLGADLPGEHDRLAGAALLRSDRAHRPRLDGLGLGLAFAARQQAGRRNQNQTERRGPDSTSAGNHGMRRALRRVYSSSDMDFCDFSRSSFSISSAALKPAIWRISSRAILAWARLRSAMPPPWVRM